MNRYLLLATVGDRVPSALVLFESIKRFLPGWRLRIVAQGYTREDAATVTAAAPAGATLLDLGERVGPHRAKAAGLAAIVAAEGDNPFVVCSIDDDMEFTAMTNLDPAVQMALRQGVGFVSAGWAPHESRVKPERVVPQFVKQAIVYTGGGMIFGAKVARIVLALPRADYFDDNTEWSLAAYLAGLDNYRWRGSMTIHRICGKGGRRAWVKLKNRVITDARWLRVRQGNTPGRINDYLVGGSADITPEAHARHKLERALRMAE